MDTQGDQNARHTALHIDKGDSGQYWRQQHPIGHPSTRRADKEFCLSPLSMDNRQATWSWWASTVLGLVAGLPPEIARAYRDVLVEDLNGSLKDAYKRRDPVDASGGVEIVQPRPRYPTEDFTRILKGSWEIKRVDGLSHGMVVVVPGNEENSGPKQGLGTRPPRPRGPRPARRARTI